MMQATKLKTTKFYSEDNNLGKVSFLFDGLTNHQIKEISNHLYKKVYTKGEHVYQEGEQGEFIYFIESGSIKLYTNGPRSKEIIKDILYDKNVLGEQVFSGGMLREESAKAIDPEVVIYSIHVDDFLSLIQRYWTLNKMYINLVNKKLLRIDKRVESLIVDDARKRVIDFLKYNAKHKGKKIGFELLIKHSMTQQDIANYTGTSRQTVTSILNDLRKTNMIYFKRNSILIRDIASLA